MITIYKNIYCRIYSLASIRGSEVNIMYSKRTGIYQINKLVNWIPVHESNVNSWQKARKIFNQLKGEA